MEVASRTEKTHPDFTGLVLKLVSDVESLNSSNISIPGVVMVDMGDKSYLRITTIEDNESGNMIDKLSKKFNFEPQKSTEIEISCFPIKLDDDELVSVDLSFTREEWKNKTDVKFTRGGKLPSKFITNPPQRAPESGVWPVRERDTIDWSKIPEREPINENEVVYILKEIQKRINLIS